METVIYKTERWDKYCDNYNCNYPEENFPHPT